MAHKSVNIASRHLGRHLNQPYKHNIVSRHLSCHLQQRYKQYNIINKHATSSTSTTLTLPND